MSHQLAWCRRESSGSSRGLRTAQDDQGQVAVQVSTYSLDAGHWRAVVSSRQGRLCWKSHACGRFYQIKVQQTTFLTLKENPKTPKKNSHFRQKIFRADPEINHPDIQFHFLPSQVIDHGRTAPQEEAFQVHVGTLRAKSVGNLKLKSNNPRDHPVIDPRFAEIVRKFLLF